MAGLARARQTPNSVSDDRDRSVRLSPWLRRHGSRSCDTPMAGARRPCSPARPGERRRHRSAVEAPIRLRGPFRQQVGKAAPIALLIQCSSLSYDYPTGGKVRAHPFRPPSGPVIHPACGSPWAGSDCCAGAPRRHHHIRHFPVRHFQAPSRFTPRGVKPRKRKWPPGWKRCFAVPSRINRRRPSRATVGAMSRPGGAARVGSLRMPPNRARRRARSRRAHAPAGGRARNRTDASGLRWWRPRRSKPRVRAR